MRQSAGFLPAASSLKLAPCMPGWAGRPARSSGGSEVDVQHHFIDEFAFRKQARVADDEGQAQAFFVEGAFVAEAAFAEEIAVIAGVDDDGVFGEFERIEGV